MSGHASENVRELVRQTAARAWGEPASVIYLRRPSQVQYKVPDRALDGLPRGQARGRRFLRMTGVTLVMLVSLPYILFVSLLSEFGFDRLYHDSGRRFVVTGKTPRCAALPLADALRTAGRHLWLVRSPSHLALVEADDGGQPRFLWQSHGAQRPAVEPSHATLTWADGSTAKLELTYRERKRVQRGQT